MPKLHLTNPIIKNTQCPVDRKKVDLFDTETKGLMLEVRASGGQTFYLRYTNSYGETRQHRLADARDVTLAHARKMADKLRGEIARGGDPAAEKADKRAMPTFRDFAHNLYIPYVRTYKRSWDTDEGLLRNHILPRFGDRRLDDVHRADIDKMIQTRLDEGAAPGSVNRLLILVRYMYNLALNRWEIPGVKKNPTAKTNCLDENNQNDRYLSREEIERLGDAMAGSQNTMLQYIVAFLLMTGARRNEVLHARWGDIDVEKRSWRIPLPKGKAERHVPLNDGALKILDLVDDATENLRTDVIFPNLNTRKPYVSIYYAWDTARRQAGLSEVRLHDLRHTFASILINGGRSLYEVQKLLGHTQVRTTMRYAHLSNETLLEASNATSSIGDMFDKPAPANRVEHRKARRVTPTTHSRPAPRPQRGRMGTCGGAVRLRGAKARPRKNILAGMISEERRVADEKMQVEYFDYLESLGTRRAA